MRGPLEAYLRAHGCDGAFRPWGDDGGPQRAFLRAARDHRIRIFRGGNRSGKTTVGAFDLVCHLTGVHPFSRHPPGPTHWWASGVSFRDSVGAVMWPAIKRYLPMDLVREIVWLHRKDPETPASVVLKDGSTLRFKSVEQGRDKYQGERLHGIWIDEEHPPEIVEECRARLLDHAGYLTVTLTPVRRERWVRDLEQIDGTFLATASTLDAARAGVVDLQATMDLAAQLPERQRRVRILGEHVTLEGAVYPEFDRSTHCAHVRQGRLWLGDVSWPWPLPPAWPRWLGIDFGYANPTAVVLACQDPFHRRLIVERVLYAPAIRASAWARHLNRLIPPLVRAPFVDHDSFARAELEAEGWITSAAHKEVHGGIESVERLMAPVGDGTPGLVLAIDPDQVDPHLGRIDSEQLVLELETYHYPAQQEGKPDVRDQPVKQDDHACDALRYLVKGWEGSAGGPPLPPGPGLDPPRRGDVNLLA